MSLNKLQQRIKAIDSPICVGLDPDLGKLPEKFKQLDLPQYQFNKWIIDQTHQDVCAYKANTAFYEARGEQGWRELRLTIEYLRQNHPDIFTICDAKRADIGNTNRGYVEAIFDRLGFDAITLHPYLGREALAPFLEREDKVSIILCRTSNSGAGEMQDSFLDTSKMQQVTGDRRQDTGDTMRLWQLVAEKVANDWNQNNNCMLVVGATYPDELKHVRSIVGDMPFLVPGVGTQGGDIKQVIENGQTSSGTGLVINSSRSIIFASDPAMATAELLAQTKTT